MNAEGTNIKQLINFGKDLSLDLFKRMKCEPARTVPSFVRTVRVGFWTEK